MPVNRSGDLGQKKESYQVLLVISEPEVYIRDYVRYPGTPTNSTVSTNDKHTTYNKHPMDSVSRQQY